MIQSLKGILLIIFCIFCSRINAQTKKSISNIYSNVSSSVNIIQYGIASFYANKFQGHETANGEIYQSEKFTAACNTLPLNTWVKVTNLKNNKSINVKINDRLHSKNKRLIDLSISAAGQLDFISMGLTKVKIEVIEN